MIFTHCPLLITRSFLSARTFLFSLLSDGPVWQARLLSALHINMRKCGFLYFNGGSTEITSNREGHSKSDRQLHRIRKCSVGWTSGVRLIVIKFNILLRMVEKYRSKNSDVHKNLESVSNPINAFRMIKRLSETWTTLQRKMRIDRTDEFLQNVSFSGKTAFPEEVGRSWIILSKWWANYLFKEDLNGAITGLLRLQDTYRLDTKDLANGVIKQLNILHPL